MSKVCRFTYKHLPEPIFTSPQHVNRVLAIMFKDEGNELTLAESREYPLCTCLTVNKIVL